MRWFLVKMLISVPVIHLCFTAVAQKDFFKNNAVGVQGYYGSFLTNDPKAQYVRDSYTYFGELYFEKKFIQNCGQPKGAKLHWGAGLFFGNTGSRQYLGDMSGAFAFAKFPLITTTRFRSSFRIGAGLGWIEKPYNKSTNHKNVLIGSHLNGHINLLLQNEIRLSPHLFINAGLGFSHLSNGGITLPNLGLNTPSFVIGILYKGKELLKNNQLKQDSFTTKLSVSLHTSAGIKQLPWIGSKRYLINVMAIEINKRISYTNQFGSGVVLFYNPSLEVDPATITSNKRQGNKLQGGLYLLYEHFLRKLSVPLQFGAYLFNKDIHPALFQQIGLRYRVSGKWKVQLLLKTHAGKADFIHTGICYGLNQ